MSVIADKCAEVQSVIYDRHGWMSAPIDTKQYDAAVEECRQELIKRGLTDFNETDVELVDEENAHMAARAMRQILDGRIYAEVKE